MEAASRHHRSERPRLTWQHVRRPGRFHFAVFAAHTRRSHHARRAVIAMGSVDA